MSRKIVRVLIEVSEDGKRYRYEYLADDAIATLVRAVDTLEDYLADLHEPPPHVRHELLDEKDDLQHVGGTARTRTLHLCDVCGKSTTIPPVCMKCSALIEAYTPSFERERMVAGLMGAVEDPAFTVAYARAVVLRFESNTTPEPNTGCLLWLGSQDKDGYGEFWILNRKHRTHRLACAMHEGKPLGKLLACHTCDTTSCVNGDHLYPGTVAQNNADMVRRGRYRVGERHHNARLTAEIVRQSRAADAGSLRVLAATAGVSLSTIKRARSGETWGHVDA